MVDIKGLDKARVLKSLYDHSHVKGMGVMQAVPTGFEIGRASCRERV